MNNPNAPFPPQQVKPVAVEDLLDAYDQEVADDSASIEAEATKQARVAEEVPKKIIASKIVKKLDDRFSKPKPGAVDDDPEYFNDQEEKRESQNSDDANEVVEELVSKVPVKKMIAKFEDKELEIPEEAIFTEKIGNKTFSFKVKEAVKALVNQEKFNRDADTRATSFKMKETKLQQELDGIKGKFRQMAEGDHLEAMRIIAELAGRDPADYEKEFFQNFEKVFDEFKNMTSEQRDLYFANQKINYLNKKTTQTESDVKIHQEREATRTKANQLMKEHNLTEDQFVTYLKELKEIGFDLNQLQPEEVIAHHLLSEHVKKVGQALALVDKSIASDEDFVKELIAETKDSNDLSVEDISKIIRDAMSLDSEAIENLNRKVQKSNSEALRIQLSQGGSEKKIHSEDDDELAEFFIGRGGSNGIRY